MILPNKHITLENSYIGVGAIILNLLKSNGSTVSELWDKARLEVSIKTFKRFSLGLVFLYAIDAIRLNKGLIQKTNNDQ